MPSATTSGVGPILNAELSSSQIITTINVAIINFVTELANLVESKFTCQWGVAE